jgi:hypothetical protein
MRTLQALIIAIGAVFLLAGSADAAPLGLGTSAAVQSGVQEGDVLLVRDGCGRGMRWSNRRGHCVPMDGPGPGPDPAAAIIGGVIGGAIQATRPRGDGCPRGWRFSNSRGRCVPM